MHVISIGFEARVGEGGDKKAQGPGGQGGWVTRKLVAGKVGESRVKKCYFCRGVVVKKRIRHVHAWGEKLIVVKGTPAQVCKQCGETYLEPAVIKAIDRVTAGPRKIKETIQVPVVAYGEIGRI